MAEKLKAEGKGATEIAKELKIGRKKVISRFGRKNSLRIRF